MSVRDLEKKWNEFEDATLFDVDKASQENVTKQLDELLKGIIYNIGNAKNKEELSSLSAFYNKHQDRLHFTVYEISVDESGRTNVKNADIRNDKLMEEIESALKDKEKELSEIGNSDTHGLEPPTDETPDSPGNSSEASFNTEPSNQPTSGNYYDTWKKKWEEELAEMGVDVNSLSTGEKFESIAGMVDTIIGDMGSALESAKTVEDINKVYGEIDDFTYACWAQLLAKSSIGDHVREKYIAIKIGLVAPKLKEWVKSDADTILRGYAGVSSNEQQEQTEKVSRALDKYESIIKEIEDVDAFMLTVDEYTQKAKFMQISIKDTPGVVRFDEYHKKIREAINNKAKELINLDAEVIFFDKNNNITSNNTEVIGFNLCGKNQQGEKIILIENYFDRFAPPLRFAQQYVDQQQSLDFSDPFAQQDVDQQQSLDFSDPSAQPTSGTSYTPPQYNPPNGGATGQMPDIELEDLSDLNNIQGSINGLTNNPNMGVEALIQEYEEAKNKVDEILNEQILKMMTEEDFKHNESFWEHYEKKSTNYTRSIITDSDKKAWLESMSGKDGRKDRIRIASEYTRQGRDGWIEKVSDAEDEKSRKKKEIEDVGITILQKLDDILKDFDAKIKRHEDNIKANMSNIDREIQRINGSIDKLDKEKSEYEKAYQKSKDKDQQRYDTTITAYKNRIQEEKVKKEEYEKAKKLLEQNKKELQAKKEERTKYEMLIKDEKRKFAQKLQNETNVEIQFDKSTYKKSTEENLPNNAPTITTNGIGTIQIDKRKPTEIVVAQNIDLKHASPSEIMEMIDSKEGYGELLEASREAGHFSRRVVRKEMEKRLEDLLSEIEGATVEIGGIHISKKDFYNLKKLNDKQLTALIKEINEYAKKYDKAQGNEQRKIDKEMQILKLSVLLTETRTNHVKRWWFNHWPNAMSKTTSRVQDFGNELRVLARKVEDRSKFQESVKDRAFKIFGYELDPKATKKTTLDRSGKKPIQRQGIDR